MCICVCICVCVSFMYFIYCHYLITINSCLSLNNIVLLYTTILKCIFIYVLFLFILPVVFVLRLLFSH